MRTISLLCLAALAAGAIPSPIHADTPPPEGRPISATRVLDRAMAQRLRANKGLTLQWLDWNRRGIARVDADAPVWTLRGVQVQPDGAGRLTLDGTVREIGADYFVFDGLITIADTPDVGRQCSRRASWRFGITQNRHYWRLRTFEWCDDLTDYVDIYF